METEGNVLCTFIVIFKLITYLNIKIHPLGSATATGVPPIGVAIDVSGQLQANRKQKGFLLYEFRDLFIVMTVRNNRFKISNSQSATRTMKFHQ